MVVTFREILTSLFACEEIRKHSVDFGQPLEHRQGEFAGDLKSNVL